MTLPYDYSRCTGRLDIQDNLFKECINCLRRTSPGREEWQVFILPPPLEDNLCPMWIGSY